MSTTGERITRDQIEAKFRELTGDVGGEVESVRPQILTVGLAVGVTALAVVFLHRAARGQAQVHRRRGAPALMLDRLLRAFQARAFREARRGRHSAWFVIGAALWMVNRCPARATASSSGPSSSQARAC